MGRPAAVLEMESFTGARRSACWLTACSSDDSDGLISGPSLGGACADSHSGRWELLAQIHMGAILPLPGTGALGLIPVRTSPAS
jgi:hypothetical protein